MERDKKLDILKTIGTLSIILAHTYTLPEWLFQFRNFDVILLIIVSGILQSYKKIYTLNNYWLALKKRSIRIILPTWVFLTIFFGLIALYTIIFNKSFPFKFNVVLESYAMINGIGYVWIMSIYLFIALIGPIINYINQKYEFRNILIAYLIVYIVYEILVISIERMSNNAITYLLKELIIYGIGYSFVYYIGFTLREINNKNRISFALVLMSIWGIIALIYIGSKGQYINTNVAKYPPTLYYLSYGISMSLFIILLVDKTNIPNRLNILFEFIGRNSMWIYLWHILGIYIWNEVIGQDCWYLMWVFLVFFSVCITFIQNFVVKRISLKNKKVDKLIKVMFI